MRAIDDLLGQVKDDRSRAQLAEATRAYSAGAYRAAIISTWVAVALDLVAKIRELAAARRGKCRLKDRHS